jgi:hypothetical protein
MRAMAAHLRAVGCASAVTWVLEGNPSRFFYGRLGGRPVMREAIQVGGQPLQQLAMRWDPIDTLLAATAPAREG